MNVPDEIREEMRARVREWSDQLGECLVPRKRTLRFRGRSTTFGALWAMAVTGRGWGTVRVGLCDHPGCVVHQSREGETDDWEAVRAPGSSARLEVRDHPYHPVAVGAKVFPCELWRKLRGTDPGGKVRLGACGVERCVKHMTVVW